MKQVVAIMTALALLISTPTLAFAKGYSGGSTYHSSGGSYSSASHSYSSSGSSLPSSSSSSGTYHSGPSSYSGGSTYRSGSTGGTYHSGYTSSSGSSFGGSYGGSYGGSRFGLGHFASFGSGFFLGSMFHPFGWGYGGGYGGGWGGPGYSPTWSLLGIVVDLLITGLLLLLVYRILRSFARRRRVSVEPVNAGPFGSASPMYRDVDEQGVVDACCELVASRQGCYPQDVQVDLTFNRDTETFGAEILISGRRGYPLHQQDLIDAVAGFVAARERIGSRNIAVDLQFDEGIGIHASVRMG